MKNLAKIEDALDLVTKEYVDDTIDGTSRALNSRIDSIIATGGGISKIDELGQTNYVVFDAGTAFNIF